MKQNIHIINADHRAIADFLAKKLTEKQTGNLRKICAVPGGSTPFPIFDLLAGKSSAWPIIWQNIEFWMTDDRMVAEDHDASNIGRLRSAFAPLPTRITALKKNAMPPHFDLVWLGMGADGHIASLFPSSDPQIGSGAEIVQLTPDPLPPEAPFDRLSLSMDALLNCGEMMLVIKGEAKCSVLEGALRGTHDLPIARLLGAANMKVSIFILE